MAYLDQKSVDKQDKKCLHAGVELSYYCPKSALEAPFSSGYMYNAHDDNFESTQKQTQLGFV